MATATSLPARNPKTQTATPGAKNALDRDRSNRRIREAASLLGQAGDATRLQILLALAEGELHVGALCERLGQSQPGVSYHLCLLRAGGIVARRRQGMHNVYALGEQGEALVRLIEPLLEAEHETRRRGRQRRPESATTPGPATEPEADDGTDA
jgi:DNA-binding transcriptional ArsR family regulator